MRTRGALTVSTKQYDRAYFDRWYRDAGTRVHRPRELARKLAMLVPLAEYFLGHPLRRVLDVGCGEGNWRAPLKKLRPQVEYLGLDPSAYAVERFGHRRNIHQMAFGQLAEQRFSAPFDLIICANVLQYLAPSELRRGLSGFPDLLHGMAFIETYARGDDVEGDREGFRQRPAGWYRKAFAEVGLRPCGPQSWLSAELAEGRPALELPGRS